MGLEHERQRILDFVATESLRILPELGSLQQERRSAKPFVAVAHSVFEVLRNSLASRLDLLVSTVGKVNPQLASERLSLIYIGVERTLSLIAAVAVSQKDIARELECIVDWFFKRCTAFAPPPTYILHVGTQLATLDFRFLLTTLFVPLGRRDIFPELTSRFAANDLFIIHVPGSMALATGSINWPLVFHECVHAIELRANIVASHFPTLPVDRALLKHQAKNGDTLAIEALQAQELLCDAIAVYVSGPAFVWRFLRLYFWIIGIVHPSYSHPRVDLRMERLIAALRQRGFQEEAEKARAMLDDLLRDLKGSAMPAASASTAADAAQSSYETALEALTSKRFEDVLASRFDKRKEDLRRDLLEKRPVVADPGTLFTLVAFQTDCEDTAISERLADFIRLDAIATRFAELGLSG